MTSKHDRSRSGFAVLELLASIGVLMFLMACLYPAINGVYTLQDKYRTETKAIVVMNNLAARLDAGDSRDEAKIRRIFADEFNKSGLGNVKGISMVIERKNNIVSAGINGANGRMMISADIKK